MSDSHTLKWTSTYGTTERTYESAQDARAAAAHEIGARALNFQAGTVEVSHPNVGVWLRLTTQEGDEASALALSRQRTARLREALNEAENLLAHAVMRNHADPGPVALEMAERALEAIRAALAGEDGEPAEPTLCLSRHGDVLCGKPKGHAWYCGGNGFLWGERGPEGGPDA